MKFGRIFVTVTMVLATLGTVACSQGEKKAKEKKAARQAQNKALIAEGTELLAQYTALRTELDNDYKIIVADQRVKLAPHIYADHRTLGKEYNWVRLSLAQRQTAKERLASMITVLTRIIEIDTKRGVYVDHLQMILDRKTAAESFQISLGNFEKLRGEMFDDPAPANSPVYRNMP